MPLLTEERYQTQRTIKQKGQFSLTLETEAALCVKKQLSGIEKPIHLNAASQQLA